MTGRSVPLADTADQASSRIPLVCFRSGQEFRFLGWDATDDIEDDCIYPKMECQNMSLRTGARVPISPPHAKPLHGQGSCGSRTSANRERSEAVSLRRIVYRI